MAIETLERVGFQKGIKNIKVGELEQIRARLIEVLGLNNRQTLWLRQDGRVYISPPEADAIEKVFKEFNVSEEEVWDK